MPRPLDVVLTGVQSLTHLVYASSYLRHELASRGPGEPTTSGATTSGATPASDNAVSGIRLLLVPTHAGTSPTAAQVRSLLPDDARLTTTLVPPGQRWWRDVGPECVLLSVGAPGLRALSRLLRSRGGRRPPVVIIDEGIGSYGNWRSRRAAYLRKGGGDPWVSLRAAAVAGANALVPDVRWPLYRQRPDGRWYVDPAGAQEFRRHLDDQQLERPAVVYLTQPWVALGAMTAPEHAVHIDHLRTQCEQQGLAFAVRPHPLDDADVYGDAWVMDQHSPAEFDRRIADARLVIGGSSTALLNIRAIHGTPVLRIGTAGLARLDRTLSARQRALLDAFLPPAVPLERVEVTAALP